MKCPNAPVDFQENRGCQQDRFVNDCIHRRSPNGPISTSASLPFRLFRAYIGHRPRDCEGRNAQHGEYRGTTMLKSKRKTAQLAALAALLLGCSTDSPTSSPVVFDRDGIGRVEATLLTDVGGRVAWYSGNANHRDISFDATSTWYDLGSGLYDRRTDIYRMDERGTGRRCITCNNA